MLCYFLPVKNVMTIEISSVRHANTQADHSHLNEVVHIPKWVSGC